MAQKVILLVEDNEDNRIVYTAILEHYDYAVIHASNGQKGVEAAAEHRPDLILMDLQMPVMDGFEAARGIRAHHETEHTPIVCLSARDVTVAELAEAGFTSCLRKPIEPSRVIQEVQRVIGQSRGA